MIWLYNWSHMVWKALQNNLFYLNFKALGTLTLNWNMIFHMLDSIWQRTPYEAHLLECMTNQRDHFHFDFNLKIDKAIGLRWAEDYWWWKYIITPGWILIALPSFWAHENCPQGLEVKSYFSFWKSDLNRLISIACNSELIQRGAKCLRTYLFLSTFWLIHWQS
jgi:hypothetical protein